MTRCGGNGLALASTRPRASVLLIGLRSGDTTEGVTPMSVCGPGRAEARRRVAAMAVVGSQAACTSSLRPYPKEHVVLDR
jgi:hypothetical protein